MSEKGKYRRLLNNTAIIGAGQIGSKVLVYLLVRLYTSVMSSAEYSVASNVTETATLLIPLISLGIGEAVFRFAMDKSYSKKDVFTNGYVAFFLGALLFALALPVISAIPYFEGLSWLIVLYVVSSVLHTLCSQFIRAEGKFKLYALQGLINTSLTIVCNIIFLIPLQMSYVGYVLSVCVADLLSMLLIFVGAKLWSYFDFRAVKADTLKQMLKFSIPMIPTSIFWWITNVSDRFMITYFVGDSVNGLYSAAYKIPTLLMVLSGIFINAWRNSAIDEKDSDEYNSFYERVFDMFSGIIFIIASGIVAFTPLITFLMFDPSYGDAWIYIPVLTAAMVFFNFVSFLGSVYVVSKKTVWSFVTSLAGALINIALNFILIPRIGALGAAVATLASFVVVFVLRVITTRMITSFNLKLPKLVLNSSLLALQCIAMNTRIPCWIVIEALCLTALVALNALPYLNMMRDFIKKRRSKGA